MGGIVYHSLNLPDPDVMSSSKANTIAFMAESHIRMLLAELEGVEYNNL
jgi:hypothetical protein